MAETGSRENRGGGGSGHPAQANIMGPFFKNTFRGGVMGDGGKICPRGDEKKTKNRLFWGKSKPRRARR